MKKLLMVLSLAVAMVFASCGGDAKAKLFTDYEALVNKQIEVMKKAQSGDATAVSEMTKIAEEAAKFAQDNASTIASLSTEEQAEFAKIAQKAVVAAQAQAEEAMKAAAAAAATQVSDSTVVVAATKE